MAIMRLTYVPIPGSHHVYLNGLEMREGTDWSDDGTGLLTFLSPMAQVSADLIEVLYAHYSQQVVIAPPSPVMFSDASGFSSTMTLAPGAGILPNDFLVVIRTSQVDYASIPPGWTRFTVPLQQSGGSYSTNLYTRFADGSSLDTISGSSGNTGFYQLSMAGYRRMSGIASYASSTEGNFASFSYLHPQISVTNGQTVLYINMSQADTTVGDAHKTVWGTPAPTHRLGASASRSYHRIGDLVVSGNPSSVRVEVVPNPAFNSGRSWTGYTLALQGV